MIEDLAVDNNDTSYGLRERERIARLSPTRQGDSSDVTRTFLPVYLTFSLDFRASLPSLHLFANVTSSAGFITRWKLILTDF